MIYASRDAGFCVPENPVLTCPAKDYSLSDSCPASAEKISQSALQETRYTEMLQ